MKNILFPFKIDQDNKIAYAKAMDMAKQMGGKVICFTTIKEESATTRDNIYFHLLELHGYYQTNYNDWQIKPKVSTKRVIKIGNFDSALQHFLASNAIDWMVPTAAIKGNFHANYSSSLQMDLIKNTKVNYPHLSINRN